MIRAAIASAALMLSMPATAQQFYQASTRHFVIYSDQNPETVRRFAENLEKFDKAARLKRQMADLPPSKGNRLTIFVLPSEKDVQRLANDKTGFIGGFYKGRASGSIAYVPKRTGAEDPQSGTSLILLHEYAHHLMMQDLANPYPQWFVEGFAEFMSTAKFGRDGSVGLGLPAHHRFYGLISGNNLPLETLLSDKIGKITVAQRESIYGQGWLLTHYLTFTPSRSGQLQTYIQGLAKGQEPLVAAQGAFGDIKKLERDLNAYLGRKSLPYIELTGSALKIDRVDVTPLSPGASLTIPVLAKLKNDADQTTAEPLAVTLRQTQKTYPGDPFVEVALAEAELISGHAEAALKAADRALAADSNSTDAMILKGRATVEQLIEKGDATPAEFADARQWFLKANKLDQEDPEPLAEFYRSFVMAGGRPTPNAIAALHYASDLAPQDLSLRMNSAMAYLAENKTKEARTALIPVAYDPHAGGAGSAARRMIERIDAGDASGALAATRSLQEN